MRDALVIIPTYNELENLRPIVERVLATGTADVLIVDDGSPDGTGRLADELAHADPAISVLHRSEKSGLGMAYLAGFEWGLARGYTALVEMDADGSHHPEALPELLAQLVDHDLVLGSRWVEGGRVENWPAKRKLLSRGGNLYAQLALGIAVKDATGGFRAYRSSALERIGLTAVESHGYCFQLDLVWRALQAGLRVVEVPITFTERTVGESKMSGSIVRESLVRVTVWGLRRRAQAVRAVVVNHHRLPSVRATSSVVR
ncbi:MULTISPECIES: polyprenol monophosphomannose synthase [Subtercola]|uniref:Polyprenol monophosphomannose synthase n=1 Tax=Subtercola vilae TaxID=2056433 RepID=A0A4T2C575_9MICO|nr:MULTISPECIES: polyprenol monophosphomannose synthase [Subtercola]MEA9985461.1 polyprenol monophosphomannose synthase [Subtercola sp. RTI3]TIH39317.1 polyprenol monophosphomannose synthase [Subtercola vilae]